MRPIIELHSLSKTYGEQTVLLPLDLQIQNGEFLTLLGPSGCGKTTLLRLLSGFETPDSGTILLNGKDITRLPPEQRHLNLVFQNYALFPHMSVYENIAFGLQCQKLPKAEIKSRVEAMMQRVQIAEYADRKPNQLSGGQQQRVAIARAAVNEPLVLLLDEPFSALDYHLRKDMRIELKSLQRRLKITFIFVTHDQEEALSMSDRVVVMNKGKIEQIGKPRDVYEEPTNLFVAKFIGEANIFNTQVLDIVDNKIEVNIAGDRLYFKNPRGYSKGDQINILFRPEDIEVFGTNEIEDKGDLLHGHVSEVIYKGSTVDLVIQLHNGESIFATQFFDEDNENLDYQIGERVLIAWKPGWEVILPDEK
jgi:spermidine/putrescine transport system ATP-binding protein